jgi:hypothetical protein
MVMDLPSGTLIGGIQNRSGGIITGILPNRLQKEISGAISISLPENEGGIALIRRIFKNAFLLSGPIRILQVKKWIVH